MFHLKHILIVSFQVHCGRVQSKNDENSVNFLIYMDLTVCKSCFSLICFYRRKTWTSLLRQERVWESHPHWWDIFHSLIFLLTNCTSGLIISSLRVVSDGGGDAEGRRAGLAESPGLRREHLPSLRDVKFFSLVSLFLPGSFPSLWFRTETPFHHKRELHS